MNVHHRLSGSIALIDSYVKSLNGCQILIITLWFDSTIGVLHLFQPILIRNNYQHVFSELSDDVLL
jgi:hypothetical protein